MQKNDTSLMWIVSPIIMKIIFKILTIEPEFISMYGNVYISLHWSYEQSMSNEQLLCEVLGMAVDSQPR